MHKGLPSKKTFIYAVHIPHNEIFSHAYGCHSQFVNVQTASHLYTSQDKEDRIVQQNYLYVTACDETPPLEDECH